MGSADGLPAVCESCGRTGVPELAGGVDKIWNGNPCLFDHYPTVIGGTRPNQAFRAGPFSDAAAAGIRRGNRPRGLRGLEVDSERPFMYNIHRCEGNESGLPENKRERPSLEYSLRKTSVLFIGRICCGRGRNGRRAGF